MIISRFLRDLWLGDDAADELAMYIAAVMTCGLYVLSVVLGGMSQ